MNQRILDAYTKQWDEGRDWALSLKVGDTFRGSWGEAKHRGYDGPECKAFSDGALSALDNAKGVWTKGNSLKIIRIIWN